MNVFLTALVRAAFTIAVFAAVIGIETLIWKLLPDSRVKRILFSPIGRRRGR